MSENHPLDGELRDLWCHRRDLDAAGWTRLYEIAMTVLMNYKPRELAGLPEDRNVYIQEFFQDKVLRLDLSSRAITSARCGSTISVICVICFAASKREKRGKSATNMIRKASLHRRLTKHPRPKPRHGSFDRIGGSRLSAS
jgi:hypothetical protein